jgi:hypothetical protein
LQRRQPKNTIKVFFVEVIDVDNIEIKKLMLTNNPSYSKIISMYEIFSTDCDQHQQTHPVKITRLRIILSQSTVFSEPKAATAGVASTPALLRIIVGRGGNEVFAQTEATEKRPAWRNLSILLLSVFMDSLEKIGLQNFCHGL